MNPRRRTGLANHGSAHFFQLFPGMLLIPVTVLVILGSAWIRRAWRQVMEDDKFESNTDT